ncbi:hypothetical protein [Tenacibaculum amylolyticum]|uniref:hypothetical protein n=1 Tax=Tenacibaculum amylolyticum TaxID=104269 RepID=UPI003895D68B
MRYLFLFSILIICLSCSNKSENPDFLVGKWKRVNNETGKNTYEIWNSNFSGLGYTLKDKDTVFKEDLNIVKLDGSTYLQVKGVNENPTFFKITELSKNSFTCYNNKNEFPKKISYWLENKQLYAKVSNDDFAIDFIFEKMD